MCTYTQLYIMEQFKSYQIILLKSFRQKENKTPFFINEVLGWKKWGKENIDQFHFALWSYLYLFLMWFTVGCSCGSHVCVHSSEKKLML